MTSLTGGALPHTLFSWAQESVLEIGTQFGYRGWSLWDEALNYPGSAAGVSVMDENNSLCTRFSANKKSTWHLCSNRIIELLRLEKTLKVIESNCNLTNYPNSNNPPLNHVPEHHIQTVFKHIQGWWINHIRGEPIPVLNNPFCKEVFPDIQHKLTLAQLKAKFN